MGGANHAGDTIGEQDRSAIRGQDADRDPRLRGHDRIRPLRGRRLGPGDDDAGAVDLIRGYQGRVSQARGRNRPAAILGNPCAHVMGSEPAVEGPERAVGYTATAGQEAVPHRAVLEHRGLEHLYPIH